MPLLTFPELSVRLVRSLREREGFINNRLYAFHSIKCIIASYYANKYRETRILV